jgi:hypothetical protein
MMKEIRQEEGISAEMIPPTRQTVIRPETEEETEKERETRRRCKTSRPRQKKKKRAAKKGSQKEHRKEACGREAVRLRKCDLIYVG